MKWRVFWLAAGPLAALLVYWACFSIGDKEAKTLALAAWMVLWWISQPVNLAVTALLPLVFFPMLNLVPARQTAAFYGHDIVFLFLGGFLIGLAMEKHRLHERIALLILLKTGGRPIKVLLGFMLATGFLSMWISNTATTLMMLPMATSVLPVFNNATFGRRLLLAIAYSSSLGGMATLIGTPPNVVLRGQLAAAGLGELSFFGWFSMAFPLTLVLGLVLYLLLGFGLRQMKGSAIHEIRQRKQDLGTLSMEEKRVALIFIATAAAWIFRPLLEQLSGLPLNDTGIAMAGGLLMFMVPSGKRGKALLDWEDTRKMAWGIILLFGGGLSLAGALEQAGIIERLGMAAADWGTAGLFALILGLSALALFLTEIMSNVALVSILLPVVLELAKTLGINPLQLAIPVTLAASCAFMLPMATPPNALVFAGGQLKVSDMTRYGIWMNLVSVLLISLVAWRFF